MIRTETFTWVDSKSRHRNARLQYISAFLSKEMYPEDALREGLGGVQSYAELVESHLDEISQAFKLQFGISQYRRKSDADIRLLDTLKAIAKAHTKCGNPTIEVSTGLLYALEDMWQCVISDNNTDLYIYGGSGIDSENDVIRNIALFNVYDKFRFFDYRFLQELYEIVRKSEVESIESILIHAEHANKMISADRRRVIFGDFLTDLSMQWILSHEDAHIYSGHAHYYINKLGISADEMEGLDDAFRKAHLSTKADKIGQLGKLRVLTELAADDLACLRMIDSFFDDEVFVVYPFLSEGLARLNEQLQTEFRESFAEKEIRFIFILRLCIIAGIASVLLFHRSVEKNKIDSLDYPDINIRISNIVITSLMRARRRLDIPGINYQSFSFPSSKLLTVLSIGISKDIEVISWNLLKHKTLLVDPDLPFDEPLKCSNIFSTLMPNGSNMRIVFEAIMLIQKLEESQNVLNIGYYISQTAFLYDLFSLQSQYFEQLSPAYKELQKHNMNSSLHAQYDESFSRLRAQSSAFKKIVLGADLALSKRDRQLDIEILRKIKDG